MGLWNIEESMKRTAPGMERYVRRKYFCFKALRQPSNGCLDETVIFLSCNVAQEAMLEN